MIIPIIYNQGIGKSRHGRVLKEISKNTESKSIIPLMHDEIYSFERIGEAHALLESGKAIGKVILRGFD